MCSKTWQNRCEEGPKKFLLMQTPKKVLKNFKREISHKFDVTKDKIVPACNISCHLALLLQKTFMQSTWFCPITLNHHSDVRSSIGGVQDAEFDQYRLHVSSSQRTLLLNLCCLHLCFV